MIFKSLFEGKKIYGALLAGLCMANVAWADSEMLCSVKLDQPEGELKAELWGEALEGGYNKDLLLMLKDSEGKLLAAHTPDIAGGYNPYMKAIKLKGEKKEKQLLLAVGEGNWKAPTSYRIFDLRNTEKIKAIFTARDNLGVVDQVELQDKGIKVTLQDGRSYDVGLVEEVLPKKVRGNGKLDFQRLHSLSVYGGNKDGKDILLLNQQITAGDTLLADVGAVYYYKEPVAERFPKLEEKAAKAKKAEKKTEGKEEKHEAVPEKKDNCWTVSNFAIMANSSVDRKNHINDGLEFSKAIILPRKMLLGRKEATYPLIICPGKEELADKMNKLLEKEGKPYYDSFFHMERDVAFDVQWASNKLLAIQFICGNDKFDHHTVNIDPVTGEKIELKDIINIKDPDLLPLLNLLKTNDLVDFKVLPREWYIARDRLYLQQKVEGKDIASSYSLEDLNKFIVSDKWKK